MLWMGKLNIFYSITRQFSGTGSQDPGTWNFVMQSFADPANLNSGHTLIVLSVGTATVKNAFHSTATLNNNIFGAYLSAGNPSDPNNDPVHIAKVNLVGPTVVITSPTELNEGGLTDANQYSTALTDKFTINFTVSEPDVTFPNGYKWDTTQVALTNDQRSITITGGLISYDEHVFNMTVVDEVGNYFQVTRYITLTGIPIELIFTIVLIIVIAVAVVAILFLVLKYRKKFSQRQVQLKLGGKGKQKAAGKEGWGEEEGEEAEEGKDDSDDMDLKKDLKKVDF